MSFAWRDDAAVPPFPDDKPVIVFDGHCVLCSSFAQFVLRHDRQARYRLAAAQSPLGQALYRHCDLDPTEFETNLLVADGRVWVKSEGTLRMFAGLGWPWSMVMVLRLLPRRWLDHAYAWVARNRLQWFGAHARCWLPNPAQRDRFLT